MTWRKDKFFPEDASRAIKKILTGPEWSGAQQFWGCRTGRHPAQRLMVLLPPRCFPNHLGRKRELAKKVFYPTGFVSERRWRRCHGRTVSWSSCCPATCVSPPATRGEAPMSQKGWQQQLLTQCWRAPEATWAAEVQWMEIVRWSESRAESKKKRKLSQGRKLAAFSTACL